MSLLVGVGVGLGGCTTSNPDISGEALANTRFVNSGDVVTLSSPLTPDGERQWRIVSMDPAHLAVINQPRIVRDTEGTGAYVVMARAKAPGLTNVYFAETNPADGRKPRRVHFRVRIWD